MQLTRKEMTWYKQHQVEIENIIGDERAFGEYFEDDDLDMGDLDITELERIIFYILYNAKGTDGFYTITCGEDSDVSTFLMPGGILEDYNWAQDFSYDFGVEGIIDTDKIAYYIRKGAELEDMTEGIREEVAKCFEECWNNYDVS